MKTVVRFGLTLGLLAGSMAAGFSGATADKVASPSHSAFVLFEFDVKDKAALPKVAAATRESSKHFKGEFVMREKVDSLFGGTPANLSVISFPTVADAKAWLASPEFIALKPERDKVADVRTFLVEKMD